MTNPLSPFLGNNPSFFQNFSSATAQDLMTLQLTAGQVEPAGGYFTTTNPIVPDRLVSERVTNFDPDLYDLRDQSTLMKLLKVLLGGAGAGGLRKQAAIARLQNTFSGMHFLDLDRFYGALFGISRSGNEVPPDFTFDPYHGAASADTWDNLHSLDASYRDRLIKFAKSIYYGATPWGIQSMVESLIGADCDIFESWEWVDEQNAGIQTTPTLIYTYSFLSSSIASWSGLEGHTWSDWGGGTTPLIGRTGQKTRNDFIVQPKRNLSPDEQYEIVRVVNTFKPAGTQFTVVPQGLVNQSPITIRSVAADSEYWEVVSTTQPNPQLPSNPYSSADIGKPAPQLRPAFCQYQGEDWTYNNDILALTSYTQDGGVDGTATNDQTIVYADGSQHIYGSHGAPLAGFQAISARIISDGVLTTVPYAPTRSSLNPALVA